jgi:hypothetical protein
LQATDQNSRILSENNKLKKLVVSFLPREILKSIDGGLSLPQLSFVTTICSVFFKNSQNIDESDKQMALESFYFLVDELLDENNLRKLDAGGMILIENRDRVAPNFQSYVVVRNGRCFRVLNFGKRLYDPKFFAPT